ncbi:homeobox-leucine zipper protein HDG11 [Tanacetum coccineum]
MPHGHNAGQGVMLFKADLSKRLVLLQKDFDKLEALSVSLELELQNESLILGLSERFLRKSSDVDNVNNDNDEIETINIELEYNSKDDVKVGEPFHSWDFKISVENGIYVATLLVTIYYEWEKDHLKLWSNMIHHVKFVVMWQSGTVKNIGSVVEDVGEDEDYKSGSWVSATEYVNANGGIMSGCLGDIKNFLKNRKLDQVGAIVKYCTPNVIGVLTVTLKDLSGTIPNAIYHKVIDEGGYGKGITIGVALILANLQVYGNVIDQKDLYKFDEEALNLTLEEEARKAWAEHEWLEKSECGGALGALKPSTHHVITIFLYTLGAEVEATCALEVKAMGALDLVEALKVEVEATRALDHVKVEASCLVGALDVVGFSLNIFISAPVNGYLTSLKHTSSSSPEKPSSLDT